LQGHGIVNRPIVLGTRGSALALAQVDLLMAALRQASPGVPIEVKKITTSGDRRTDYTGEYASGAGVKGLFTREIEQELLAGGIDVAVHSCKDLPGHLPEGLSVSAVLERADTADVFIGRAEFSSLQKGAAIGTSSVRRRRQLRHLRPDLEVREMRGNVPTRIEKLAAAPELAGIVLARAGLDRLGINLGAWHVQALPILPAIGQGAIALKCRADDAQTAALLAAVNHAPTFTCIRAERELLRLLNGDCHLPVGVATQLDGETLSMRTIIFGEEGTPPLEGSASGSAAEPERVAQELFHQLYP
jgi:hydroxymethylbilane synthase